MMNTYQLHKIVEKFAWEALQEQARHADSSRTFHAFSSPRMEESLESRTKALCEKSGTALSSTSTVEDAIALTAVGEVFNSALALGLVMHSTKPARSTTPSHEPFVYQFTSRGFEFFRSGEISLSAPGLLVGRVREVVSEFQIEPGVAPLAEEAQRCWAMGCQRAGMVMVGLASEAVCTDLLNELCSYPSPPGTGGKLLPDWEKLNNEALSFYPRWQSGLKSAGIREAEPEEGLRRSTAGLVEDLGAVARSSAAVR